MAEALVERDVSVNIHQAVRPLLTFAGLASADKGCENVCVCVCVSLNSAVSVSALLRIQDAYFRSLSPGGLEVGAHPAGGCHANSSLAGSTLSI